MANPCSSIRLTRCVYIYGVRMFWCPVTHARSAAVHFQAAAPAVAHATAEPQLPSDEMVELAVGDLDVHRRPPAAQRLRASTVVAVGEDGGHGASSARRAWPSLTVVIAYVSPTSCRCFTSTGSRSLKSWLLAAASRSAVAHAAPSRTYLLTPAICSDQHRVWTVAGARVVRLPLSRSGTPACPDGSGKCTSKCSHHNIRTLYAVFERYS